MTTFSKNLLVILAIATCLFSIACVPDAPIPRPEEPDPLVCDFGFDLNTVQDSCECLAPNVRIVGTECREPNAEEFYASLEGCVVDIGILFYYRDDSLRNNCCRDIRIERPSRTDPRPQYDFSFLWQTTLANGVDSIYFQAPSAYLITSPSDSSRFLDMRFVGKYTDENTIEGEFQWAKVMTDSIEVTCPGIFRRWPE